MHDCNYSCNAITVTYISFVSRSIQQNPRLILRLQTEFKDDIYLKPLYIMLFRCRIANIHVKRVTSLRRIISVYNKITLITLPFNVIDFQYERY
jgi:hypothetical protein